MNTKIIIKIIFKMNSKKKTIYIFLIALCLWPTTKGPYHLVQWGAKKLFLVGHVQQNLRSFVSKSFETFFARYVFWLSCYAPETGIIKAGMVVTFAPANVTTEVKS